MKRTKNKFFLLLTMVSLLATSAAFAEGSEGEGAEPPPQEGPINQAVPVLALVGLAFAYKAMTKKQFN